MTKKIKVEAWDITLELRKGTAKDAHDVVKFCLEHYPDCLQTAAKIGQILITDVSGKTQFNKEWIDLMFDESAEVITKLDDFCNKWNS